MKKIAAALLLLSLSRIAPAQTKPDDQLSPTVRIYKAQNMTPGRAQQVGQFVTDILGHKVLVDWSPVPDALVIRGGSAADMDAAELLLKRFDVPEPKTPSAPQADLTAYLILATSGKPATAAASSAPTKAVPAELKSAVAEMKRTFPYDNYSLLDTIPMQPHGPGEFQDMLPLAPAVLPGTLYAVAYDRVSITESRNVNVGGLQFSIKLPGGQEPRIKTNVTIHENQKLVLGKLRLNPSGDADLFLVLTARLQ